MTDLEKEDKSIHKIISNNIAKNLNLKFLVLVTSILIILLSVSYVLALTNTFGMPSGSGSWENTLMFINTTTDGPANCSYNVSDGTNSVIGTLTNNNTAGDHLANNVDITDLDEGTFYIYTYCWNATDETESDNSTSPAQTKDTSGVEVLAWIEPEAGWTIQNGSVMMINISANSTTNIDTSKTDVFDVSDCGAGGSVSAAEYNDGPDGEKYVNATWTVGSAVDVNCNIVANLTTG